jgi:hypothetical protein
VHGHGGRGHGGRHRGLGLFSLLLVPSAGGALIFLGLGAGIFADVLKEPGWWFDKLWLPVLIVVVALVWHGWEKERGR